MTSLRILFGYVPWLLWQLAVAALRLGVDVCTPGSAQQPRIVKLPMPGFTDAEVTLLTSSITITPATVVVGIAPASDAGPRAAFVQALFGADETALMESLERMQEKVLLATRGRGSAPASRMRGAR